MARENKKAYKTFTVFIPAPAGHTGSVNVKVNGSVTATDKDGKEIENRVAYQQTIPYNTKVEGVPEVLAQHILAVFEGADISPE